MVDRRRIPNGELKAMIMEQIRPTADCAGIWDVEVFKLDRTALHIPNWNASFRSKNPEGVPAEVKEIVTQLQQRYDLAGR